GGKDLAQGERRSDSRGPDTAPGYRVEWAGSRAPSGATEQPVREMQNRRLAVIADLKSMDNRHTGNDPQGRKELIKTAINALMAIDTLSMIYDQTLFGVTRRHKPWALTVRTIGRYTLAVLQSADTAVGRERREGFNGAAVNFIFAKLQERLGPDEGPERTAVIRVLRQIAPVRLRHRDT
ncbi:MAG TPA: hypothetical protein VI756_05200, partial [Blastocatellia bacterium]